MKYSSHWKQIPVNLCFSIVVIQPFWKAKPEVYQKILEERAVIVSAIGSPKIKLTGGGVAEVPIDFAFKETQNYAKLDQHVDLISNAKWNAQTSELDMDFHVLSIKNHLLVRIQPLDPQTLNFEIREGWMKGLTGSLQFQAIKPDRTEVGLEAAMNESKSFFSRLFWSLTLEGVMKKTAESLRSYLETEWKKARPQDERKS